MHCQVPSSTLGFSTKINERYETAGRKKQITLSPNGTRHQRKLKKYSEGFNEKFSFFLNSYRKGILTFCGSEIEIEFDKSGPDSKEGFRMFDDGQFKNRNPRSRHSNILKCVIIGKKSWGLWLDQWTDGIVDWTFTREEILEIFIEKDIKIPDSFLLDFDNTIDRKKRKGTKDYTRVWCNGSMQVSKTFDLGSNPSTRAR